MKLNAPTNLFFYISLVLVVLGLAGKYAGLSAAAPYSFVLVLLGWAVLVIGVVMKNR